MEAIILLMPAIKIPSQSQSFNSIETIAADSFIEGLLGNKMLRLVPRLVPSGGLTCGLLGAREGCGGESK
jgi:hypothetical protein